MIKRPFLPHVFAISTCASLILSACASPQDYPSLATRDTERVSGSLEVAQTPRFSPTPTAPLTLEEVDGLASRIDQTHSQFLTSLESARAPVLAAQGTEIGGEEWSDAQMALANLELIRNDSLIALADLDQLYVDAVIQGNEFASIESVRLRVNDVVLQQNRLIAELASTLDR